MQTQRPGRLGRPDVLVGLMSVLQDDAGVLSLSAVYAECRVGPGVPGVPLFYHKGIDEQDLYFPETHRLCRQRNTLLLLP